VLSWELSACWRHRFFLATSAIGCSWTGDEAAASKVLLIFLCLLAPEDQLVAGAMGLHKDSKECSYRSAAVMVVFPPCLVNYKHLECDKGGEGWQELHGHLPSILALVQVHMRVYMLFECKQPDLVKGGMECSPLCHNNHYLLCRVPSEFELQSLCWVKLGSWGSCPMSQCSRIPMEFQRWEYAGISDLWGSPNSDISLLHKLETGQSSLGR
jgi:hypothetical protein